MSTPPTTTVPGAAFKAGDRIAGRWVIHGICGGRGCSGRGVVYAVRDHLTGDMLAARAFQPELIANNQFREVLIREATLWAQMGQHPNTVSLRSIEDSGPHLCLITEFVAPDLRGRNCLMDFLRDAPLDSALVLRWSLQICRAMRHMRDAGIQAHRDLKPGNVMIDRNQDVKVTDFGLGKALLPDLQLAPTDNVYQCTAVGGIAGTPGYIAPEIVQGGAASEASDIYAFGLMLVQMLTGKRWPPFTTRWQGDLAAYERANLEFRRLLQEPVKNSMFDELIARCLAFDAAERLQSFAAAEALLLDVAAEHFPEQSVAEAAATRQDATMDADIDEIASLHGLGRLDDALARCLEEKRAHPDSLTLASCEGVIRGDLGDYDEAVSLLQHCVAENPQWSPYWVHLGMIQSAAGDLAGARASYERALELEDGYAVYWVSYGNVLLALELFKEARRAFLNASGLDCCKRDARWGIVRACAGQELWVDALVACEEVLDLEPRDPDVLQLQPRLLEHLEETAWDLTEQQVLERCMELKHKKFYDALSLFREARFRLGPSTLLWNNEGVFLTDVRDYVAAERCFSRSLELDPKQAFAWTHLGRAHRCLLDVHKAIQSHERAAAHDDTDPMIWADLFACHGDLGLPDEARSCFREAVRRARKPADTKHVRDLDRDLYYLARTEIALEEREFDVAERCARSVAPSSVWYEEAQRAAGRSCFYLAADYFNEHRAEHAFDLRVVLELIDRVGASALPPGELEIVQGDLLKMIRLYVHENYPQAHEHLDMDLKLDLLERLRSADLPEDVRGWATQEKLANLLNAAHQAATSALELRGRWQ